VQAAEQGRVQQQRQLPQYFLERPQ
jgi:hypothetical protein